MSIPALTETLAAVRSAISATIITDAALADVKAIMSCLPAALTSALYLECRLAATTRRVDVIVGIDAPGREILAGCNPAISLPLDCFQNPVWARIRQLCERWGDPGSTLHDRIARIWLEFDLEVSPGCESSTVPTPGLFVDLVKHQARSSSPADLQSLVVELLEIVTGDAPSRWQKHRIHRCIQRLPSSGWIPYLGVFPSRRCDTIRCCVRGLDDRQRLEYLQEVGWSGTDRLAESVATIARHWSGGRDRQGAVLHFDVADSGIGPLLGLEYYLERRAQSSGAVLERDFLEHLVQRGLCSADKHQGLCAWPGYEIRRLKHEIWPSLVIRRVNHIKLVHDLQGIVEAKAYLCVTHRYHQAARHAGAPIVG